MFKLILKKAKMINYLFILIAVFSVLISCKNESKQLTRNDSQVAIQIDTSAISKIIKTTRQNHQYTMDSFDWDKAIILKSKLINDLEENILSEDSVIVHFLSEYSLLEDDFNNILWNLKNYDSLNTLAYSDNNLIYKCAIDFKKKVEKSGFEIGYSEGSINIIKNTGFIKSDILSHVSPLTKEFINLYCEEIDSICCDDAAIIISQETLIERTFKWGELLDKSINFKFAKICESEYNSNLYLLFNGQDNTPAFDWTSKEFEKKSLENMQVFIGNHPDSRAANEFRIFITLLKSEGFKVTDKISQFLKDKFSDKYD